MIRTILAATVLVASLVAASASARAESQFKLGHVCRVHYNFTQDYLKITLSSGPECSGSTVASLQTPNTATASQKGSVLQVAALAMAYALPVQLITTDGYRFIDIALIGGLQTGGETRRDADGSATGGETRRDAE